MKWNIIDTGKSSAAMNMAIDETFYQLVQKGEINPVIRFYSWNPHTVSIGYNQSAKKEVDFNIVEENGYGFVRRPTGGRMVLHMNEITYSVIAPVQGRFEGSVLSSYAEISRALAIGLNSMGLDVQFEKGFLDKKHQRENANPCFASSSRYELKCGKKKIVGSSQVRNKKALLQHGSILLNANQDEVADLIPEKNEKDKRRIAAFLKRKTVAINESLDYDINYTEGVGHLIKGFKNAWNKDEFISLGFKELNIDKLITEIFEKKYSTDKWNFKK